MNPKAFIFDLDGVITDTTRYHYNAWKALADQKGFAFNEVCNERLKGVGRNRCMEIILEENGIRARFSDSEIQEMADEKNEKFNSEILFNEDGSYKITTQGTYKIDTNYDYKNLIKTYR